MDLNSTAFKKYFYHICAMTWVSERAVQ